MQNQSIQRILKHTIPQVEFNKQDVLSHLHEVILRKQLLTQALFKNKHSDSVCLIFETVDGIFELKTSVFALTDEYVLLKDNIYLQIHCIYQVILI